ncbi:MerR family transcriptional regulator [Pseudoduganella danionis]|uniref:MerR family transcriptional regulator n=1 Tax=Pseudoduganella danionis TaxID=1890295 RepID=UPI0035B2ED7B
MKIGELARRTGVAASAIRFYEAQGLLKGVQRLANGYRDYPPEAATLLSILGGAQRAGFTLDEIRQLLPQDLRNWQHAELMAALQQKVAEIEALQQRLEHNRQHLQQLITLINDRPDDIDCQDNAARVLASMGITNAE